MDRLGASHSSGVAAVANPQNPIGKEGTPGKRHREIIKTIQENRDQQLEASRGLSSEVEHVHSRLNRIQSTQRWMLATLILLVILAGLTATFMGLLILRLNG